MNVDQPGFYGEWVRQRRRALDLTRVELARCAGCSVSALRKIETGERRPSKQLAGLLANCLRIPQEDHSAFIKAARSELRVERLGPPSPALVPEQERAARLLNLPIPPTPLIGRESELAALGQLLRDPQCRLLTVVGPGGIGKTRLAIEVASRHQDAFPDGVCFVPLASLSSSAFLVPAIADALGLSFQGQIELRIQLLDYLRTKQVLLVLDNVEHLLDGVGLSAELLERAPRVKLLVTSRERLNLKAEWVFEVQGLPVPPTDQAERAEKYSSVALFVQSARRARAAFELQAEERSSVVRICQVVEGMPLAIELAAAWVPVLTCREIAHEIERSLDFLTTTMRDVPERQQSLRAVFDHSWNLLSADERRVLCRLAIFRGGFRREAAELVAEASLAILSALVGRSLVRRSTSGRYDLHELVRQYAAAQLGTMPGQKAQLKERFTQYYAALLERWEGELKSPRSIEAMAAMSEEIDNLRQAWDWMVSPGQSANLSRSQFSLWWFYEMRGWFREDINLMEQAANALRTPGETDLGPGGDIQRSILLAQVLTREAFSLMRCGLLERARELLQQSLVLLESNPNKVTYARALRYLGTIEYVQGNYAHARELMEESVALNRSEHDQWELVGSLIMLGDILKIQGEYQASYQTTAECVAVARAMGEPRMKASSLRYLGSVARLLGRYGEAEQLLEESLAISRAINDRWSQARTLSSLGEIALDRKQTARAEGLLRESIALLRQIGEESSLPEELTYLGTALVMRGASAEAKLCFLEALQLATSMRIPPLILEAIVGIATIRAREGAIEPALELASYALNHPANYREAKERVEQLCAELESQLSPEQIQAVQARAQARSLDAIAAELLEQTGPMPS